LPVTAGATVFSGVAITAAVAALATGVPEPAALGGLILAAGASLKVTDLPGIGHTFNVDSSDSVQKLDEHINELVEKNFHEEGASTFVVVGSEFTGLETVTGIEQKIRTLQTYYPGKKWVFRIILVEGSDEVGSQFSKDCKEYIHDILASKNIEIITNAEPTIIGPASVLLSNGTRIAARTVIWTKGLVAGSLTQFFNGPKDDLNRLTADQFLKLPAYSNVIAAGNVAHTCNGNGHFSFMSYQYAQFEGRWAGHNAINDLFNLPMKEYVEPGFANCADLGEPQVCYVNKWERGMREKRYRDQEKERHISTETMYPWEDVEDTVKASYPEIPHFK